MEALTKDEMRDRIKELKELRGALNDEFNGKRFDDGARDRFNSYNDEIHEVEETLAEIERREAIIADSAENEKATEKGAEFQTYKSGVTRGEDIYDLSTIRRSYDGDDESGAAEIRDRALRAIEEARFPEAWASRNKEDVQGHLEHLLESGEGGDRNGTVLGQMFLATGSPLYRRAFSKALSGQHTSDEENRALDRAKTIYRAASLTAASGGYAVPFVLDPTIIPTGAGAVNPYRAISRNSQITVDEWRGVSSDGITASFGAEAAAATDNSPTLAQPTISTEKAFAFVPYSIEIGQDWSGFAGEMGDMMRDAKDVLEATKFAVGSGTNEPFGVITGSSASVYTASNTNSLVIADIYGVHDSLSPRFRSDRTVWVMNNATLSRIRQLDTAGGSAMLTPTLQARSAASINNFTDGRTNVDIFGKPVYEASGQSGTFTTGQLVGVVGDFRYYHIVDRLGLTIENIPHLFGAAQGNLPTGQRGLYAYWRVGAKVLSASAFKVLKLA